MPTPDYVVVGHVSRDLLPVNGTSGGFALGGTVTYAGLAAQRLGCRVGILTSAGPDLDLAAGLPGIEVVAVPAALSTSFENLYQGGHRRQYLRARAATLLAEHVPAEWRDAPIVHVGPLARELDPEILAAFPGARLRGLTPQGWLRQWSADGLVSRAALADPAALGGFDVVVLSEEDVDGDWEVLGRFAKSTNRLVVTQGVLGATVCRGDERVAFPAFAAAEVDPTGAGDVFAASYLIRLQETGDPEEAAVFANCAASFAVEGPSTTSLPTREAIAERRRLRRGAR